MQPGKVPMYPFAGTVSELLNKPKPFGMLSMKGRENYMKLLKLLQTCEDFTLLEALRTQGQQKGGYRLSCLTLSEDAQLPFK